VHFLRRTFLEISSEPDVSGSVQSGVLVVGIGNPDRGDDGFGPAVANRIRERMPPGVCVLERTGDVLGLIEEWGRFSTVVVVDAAAPISRPGRVHRLDLTGCRLPAGFARSSTHAFGVAEAVELARGLDRLPHRLIAYLVEGEGFDIGAPLSPVVAEAIDEVVERIVVELFRISAERQPAGAAADA
jgi:hydrogenase maturation protease